MTPVDVLAKKRHGQRLNDSEIEYFVKGVVSGEFEDYQISALLMAICINGMDDGEILALTREMARSGDMLDMSDIDGIKADKHSTGGVGDTTSLVLVPLVASCGVKMAKMSGRGLGFTGGTLDKLEAIEGVNVVKPIEDFKQQVREIGCAIVGQSANLAPADKVLYALRDVTSTVDSNPLIVSSILSKKLAAGCDVVVLDVKYGEAIGRSYPEAKALAEMMVQIGCMSGKKYSALVTSMEQPLGDYIGNALEVEEAIQILKNEKEGNLKRVALELGAHILVNAGVCAEIADAKKMLNEKIENGEGLDRLAAMIKMQGGNEKMIYDPKLLPKAKKILKVKALEEGYITGVKTMMIGEASRKLGAGRAKKTDVIDPAVGIVIKKHLGDKVHLGDVLCEIHANGPCDEPISMLNHAFVIEKERKNEPILIRYVVSPHDY